MTNDNRKKMNLQIKKIFQHIQIYNKTKNMNLINPSLLKLCLLNSYDNIYKRYNTNLINVKFTNSYIDYYELNLSKTVFWNKKYLLREINKEKYLNEFYNKLPIDIINYTLSFF